MDTTLSGTLSLTTNRAVGNKAIKIDHSSTGYRKYKIEQNKDFDATKRNDELIAEYSYDHEGLRYKKVDYLSGKTTIYIYGQGTEPVYEEVYSNDDLTTPLEKNSYLFMGTKRIAREDINGFITYYYTDHLGSTRAIDTGSFLGDDLFVTIEGTYIFTKKISQYYLQFIAIDDIIKI